MAVRVAGGVELPLSLPCAEQVTGLTFVGVEWQYLSPELEERQLLLITDRPTACSSVEL